MNKNIALSILFIFAMLTLKAQETSDCSKILKKARQIYDAGEIEKVEEMLVECVEDGFTRSEKTEALRLIILANLFDDNLSSADLYMKQLLTVNPDFKPKDNDHKEIKDLYSKFRTEPLVILDFMVGANLSYGYLMRAYSVDHFNASSDYFPRIGIQGGVLAHYSIKKSWRVNTGFFYKTKNYSIENKYNKDQNAQPTDNTNQTVDANVSIASVEFPLGITREFGQGKLVPHVGVGGNLGVYFSSSHNMERTYSGQEFADIKGTAVDTKKQSSLLNIEGTANAGVRYKIGLTGKLIFDVRFNFGMWNQSRENNRYENEELIYQYYFIPDDFLLHNLSFNVGYSQLIYRPKKLKN